MKNFMPLATVLSLVMFASLASADPIAILNHSFENPSFSGAGNNWSDSNPDWNEGSGLNGGGEFTELTTDAFGAGVTGTFHLFNHVGIQDLSSLSQDLTTNFAPNTTYTLTVAVGMRASQVNTTDAQFQIRDNADNILALGTADSSILTANSFADFNVAFATGAVAPTGPIRIFLGVGTPGTRSHFDNIRLDGTAVIPEPTSALVLLGLSGIGLMVRRRLA